MRTQGWQMAMAIGLGLSGAIALSSMTLAQTAPSNIVENPTVGTTVIRNLFGLPIEAIRGGAERGQNLFHSFQEFNISPNRAALFLVPNGTIQNVFARVTGRNLSQIDGTLATLLDGSFTASTANLFLINPNGIIFGAGSSLNVGGSFVATTANAIQFGDRGWFSASVPNVPSSLLTINPSAFLFNQINAAPIQVNSSSLYVGDRQSLLLLGGNVTLDSSFIGIADREGGRAELGGLADSGKVDLAVDGGIFRLTFPSNVSRADVSLRNFSRVDVTAGDGGSIGINARNLTLQNSRIRAGINGGYSSDSSKAGDIDVNATGSVTLVDGSNIFNLVFEDNSGSSGNINIQAQDLFVRDSQVGISIFGSGNAGNLNIYASESVELSGEKPSVGQNRGYPGGLFTQVDPSGIGKSGNLTIRTKRLSVSDGSQVQVANFGKGTAGNLFIQADAVDVFETTRYNFYDTTINADLSAEPYTIVPPEGTAGNVTIEAGRLSIRGGRITADTYGKGNAGNLRITTGQLSLHDRGLVSAATLGEGDGGNIYIFAQNIFASDSSAITSRVADGAIGNGGDINIQTNSLRLQTGSQISSFVTRQQKDSSGNIIPGGQGNAGKILITATDFITLSGTNSDGFSAGIITTTERGASGLGGDIRVNTGNLKIEDGAVIVASTYNQSQGGKILINARNLEVLNGGQVVTSTRSSGDAGTIQLDVTDNTIISGRDDNFNNRIDRTRQYLQDTDTFNQFESVDSVILNEGAASGLFTSTRNNTSGSGGNIVLFTNSLNLDSGGLISAQSEGIGKAGNIHINARGTINITDSNILTAAAFSGGDVNIVAKSIHLRGNSDIQTNVVNGSGGNIILTAGSIIALGDSDILAFAQQGKGGDITLNTRAFFGQNYRPGDLSPWNGNGRVDINASGTVSGIITLPDISFLQNGLTEFSQAFTDTTQLLANSCIVRSNKQNGSFFITGTGGLPVRPGDAPPESFPTGEIRNVAADVVTDETDKPSPSSASSVANPLPRPWKIGDPIVEPQGIYQLPDGSLVLSRECEQ